MNAGKSTALLQVAHNYNEKDQNTCLFIPKCMNTNMIESRIGIKKKANILNPNSDILLTISALNARKTIHCVLIDEAQFLTKIQVDELCQVVDVFNIPVLCYGLRTDFKGELFEGSARLLAVADELRETRTICHCGKKATMVLRKTQQNKPAKEGEQILVDGKYESVCRKHWQEAFNGILV